MFFSLPILLTFGILYLLGEWFFARKLYRWLFIIFSLVITWSGAVYLIVERIGLHFFMGIYDELGNPIIWFDGDWTRWMLWILSVLSTTFLVSIFIGFLIFWPLSRKKWWQFWKNS